MYPMPGSSAENEPTSSERNPDTEENQVDWESWYVWLTRLISIVYLGTVLYGLWKRDEIKAQVLHSATRFLQNLARHIGGLAITTEKNYNDLVRTWH